MARKKIPTEIEQRAIDIERLEDLAFDGSLFSGELDDEVHDAKANEAADINNQGTEAQITYLLEAGYSVERLEEIINEQISLVAEDKEHEEDL